MSSQYATLEEENGGSLVPQEAQLEEDDGVESVSILSRASTARRGRVVDEESLHEPLTLSPSADDPFYVFREDLYRKLDLVEENLTEFLRIIHQTVLLLVLLLFVILVIVVCSHWLSILYLV